MNFGRIWAIVLRYSYAFFKLDSLYDLFYWQYWIYFYGG